MKIAVLGCGPAGLLAARAVETMGHLVAIYAIKRKSTMPGAIYVHEPVPGVTMKGDEAVITYYKRGTREGYAEKVYGEGDAPCSWDIFPEGEHIGYNISAAYDRLWQRYERMIVDEYLTAENVAAGKHNYDLVISAIPAPTICMHDHDFKTADIWIRTYQLYNTFQNNHIVYHGDPDVEWYRYSQLFGLESFEFGHQVEGASRGIKPIHTNCDCHPEILKVGRFGKWKKGVLVHHAYGEVMNVLQ